MYWLFKLYQWILLSIILVASKKYVQHRIFTCNITLWRVRVIFLPPALSGQPDTVLIRSGLLWRFIIACNTKVFMLVFEVNFRIFLIDFNEIWDSSTGFRKSFKYQILRTYDQNGPRRFKCTDIRTWGRLKMSFASMWKRPRTSYITISNSKAHQGE